VKGFDNMNKVLSFVKVFILATFLIVTAQSSASAEIAEPLEIVNETGKPIISLYFVPMQKKSWGNDLVGSGVMNQGDRRSINYDLSFHIYKIKVEFADGTEFTRRDVDLLNTWRLSIERDGSFSRNTRG
jgi:hypothetical protein